MCSTDDCGKIPDEKLTTLRIDVNEPALILNFHLITLSQAEMYVNEQLRTVYQRRFEGKLDLSETTPEFKYNIFRLQSAESTRF